MDFRNNQKRERIEEFFHWLLNKPVELQKYIDFSLCQEYEDPNIYFPKELDNILHTTAMQRLKKVNQLGVSIKENPNAYHSRFSHSLGVYNRKLELVMNQWENSIWRQEVEQKEQKLFLIAELIKSLTHDIGHLPLSHIMEIKIIGRRDFHEEMGKRIVLEDSELQLVFSQIDSALPTILQKFYQDGYDLFNFKQHDESNYDVDRLDYLQRDSLYMGNPVALHNENYTSFKCKVTKEGELEENKDHSLVVVPQEDLPMSREVHVYEYETLERIEKFLKLRLHLYENNYFSEKTQALDEGVGIFSKKLLHSSKENELKDFIMHISSLPVDQIDLNEYVKWNDVRFWKNVMEIAENTSDSELKQLALLILPTLEQIMTFTFEALDCKNGKKTNYQNYSKEDKDFIHKIHMLIRMNSGISGIMKKENYFWDNTLFFDEENQKKVEKMIRNKLICSQASVYGYKQEEPIFIKDEKGNVFELSSHPNRTMDWKNSKKTISTSFCFLPLLSEEQRKKVESYGFFIEPSNDLPIKINMRPIQVQTSIEEYFEE